MKNNIKNDKMFVIVLLSLVSTISLYINLSKPTSSLIENFITYNFYSAIFVFMGIFWLIKSYNGRTKKLWLPISALISVCNILGYYYYHYNTLKYMYINIYQIIKTILVFCGSSILIYFLVCFFIDKISNAKFSRMTIQKNKTFNFVFNKHPFLCTSLLLIILYIPVLFIIYPGNMSPDGFDEIKQFYHLNTWSVRFINLLDPNVYINGHHSVFHTLILGGLNQLGIIISSPTFGCFLNTLFQVVVTIFVLGYCITSLKKFNVPMVVRLIILSFYILSGYVFLGVITVYKDIPFSLMILLLTVLLQEFLNGDNSYKQVVKIAITSILILLLSKKGVYVVALVCLSLIIYLIKNYNLKSRINHTLSKGVIFCIPIFVFCVLEFIVFPYYKITPGSSREMLAVPLQQIARTASNHDKDISNEDKEIINEIIDYNEMIIHYNPKSSDDIKNDYFKKDYTDEEMKNFLMLYVKMFFRYPIDFINAFLNQTISYFYLEQTQSPTNYTTDLDRMTDDVITYEKEEWRFLATKYLNKFYDLLQKIPIVNICFVFGIYNWILIICLIYIIAYCDKKNVIQLMPSLAIMLLLFVSPVAANRRYVLPIIFSIPMIIGYIITLKKRHGKRV